MDFPTKLSRLCRQRGWSQRELAEALGEVSKSTVSNWMAGRTDPRRGELARLARLFEVPVQYLVLDELEEPAEDGLGEAERRVLWAARTVGLEVAQRRIMNAPDTARARDAEETPHKEGIAVQKRRTSDEGVRRRSGRRSR